MWQTVREGASDRLLALAVGLVVFAVTGRALLGLTTVDLPTDDSLRRRPLLLAGVAWAASLALVVRWRPLAAFALLAGAVGGWLLTMAGRTSGRIEPTDETITYGSRTAPLDAIDRVRRLPLGPVTLYWLRFERGAVGSGVPRGLVVPRTVDADVGRALDAGVSASVRDHTHHRAGRAERGVAAALGVGCLLAGPVLWVALPASGDATLVTLYLTAIATPFGVVLLRYGLVA